MIIVIMGIATMATIAIMRNLMFVVYPGISGGTLIMDNLFVVFYMIEEKKLVGRGKDYVYFNIYKY